MVEGCSDPMTTEPPNYFQPGDDPTKQDPRINMPVRFVGGRHNGFEGYIHWAATTCCSVICTYEGKTFEVVEDFAFLLPLAVWQASKSGTELSLKGH